MIRCREQSQNCLDKMETHFKIFPKHCNHQPYNENGNVIFGGEAFSQMDSLAASLCKKLLFKSETADYGVTWKYDGAFHRPVGCGDIIRFEASLISNRGRGVFMKHIEASPNLRGKTLEIMVKGYLLTNEGEKFFSEGHFCFVTKKGSEYQKHNLK